MNLCIFVCYRHGQHARDSGYHGAAGYPGPASNPHRRAEATQGRRPQGQGGAQWQRHHESARQRHRNVSSRQDIRLCRALQDHVG